MRPETFVAALAARGVVLEAADGRVRWTPRDALTAEDVAMLRAMKPAVLALLAAEEDLLRTPCGCCWRPLIWTPDWPQPGEGRWLCAYCPTVPRPVRDVAPEVQAVVDHYRPPRRLAS